MEGSETRDDNRSDRSQARPLAETDVDDDLIWALVDAGPDALVVVDETGTVMLVNRRTEALFGWDRGELLGQPIEVLVPEQARNVHRAHRTRYRADPVVRPMGDGATLWGRAVDGSEFPVEISLSPVRSNSRRWIVAAIRDVSNRLESERNSRAIRHAIDTAVDGIFIVDDTTMAFTYANDEAATMHGYTVDELIGMTPLHLAPDLDENSLGGALAPLVAGSCASVTIETTALRRDGSTFPVEVHINHPPAADHERSRSFVAVVRDITERVRSAQELVDVQAQTRVLADRERLARDLHDRVIGDLFGLGLTLQTAVPGITDADASARVERAVSGLDHTINLLRDTIFDLTTPKPESSARSEIQHRVAELHDRLGHHPKLTLSGPIDELPAELVDEATAVVGEALTNIAKHAKAASTDVAIDAEPNRLTITVTDDGIGLPAGGVPAAGGLGIANLNARAAELGGRCVVGPADGGGVTLTWTVPTVSG